ncbi:hypothetical protein DTO046C5_8187 [Penicillium roqueforti]|nr:hypothetical protein DTO046C5_8187 [Penicillium roqueforti]
MGSPLFRSPPIHRAEGLPYFTPANDAGAAINAQDPSIPTLFRPLRIRDVILKNRVIVAPMCTYSAESDPTSPAVGALTDFHIAHLGHLATKGVGLIIIEATSVQPNGRISPNDSGLWQDGTDSEQFKGLQRVVKFAHSQGAKIGVQLAHAGRKASTVAPWLASQAKQRGIKADESVGGWPSNVVGPSGGEEQIWAPGDQFWPPRELETAEVEEIVRAFARSAGLAVQAGVDVIEIHGAHGYLLHQFLSPITNRRTDKYGGSFQNRTRFLCEVAAAIRAVVPSGMPLFLRISATDWLENQTVAEGTGSWDMPSSIQLAKMLPDLGIDFLDVSSGGNHRSQRIEPHTNYQIDLAGQIRQEIHAAKHKTLVGAVGFITEPESARDIVQGAEEERQANEAMLSGLKPQADAVLMARQFLREPEWVLAAAKKLDVKVSLPRQFARGLL